MANVALIHHLFCAQICCTLAIVQDFNDPGTDVSDALWIQPHAIHVQLELRVEDAVDEVSGASNAPSVFLKSSVQR
eukprot:708348-Pelagomonas_calceolata.AAC.1